ncbi:MAG: amidohydrolase family protein, partial [Candidatus Limnocylindrales bacterium]
DAHDDTDRVLRYLAKVTIEPAITHGVADHVGSLRTGRLADIVLWRPAFFGAKPELVLKAGYPAWGPLGDGNASLEHSEPTRYRPDWGGSGLAAATLGVTFVSAAAGPGTSAGEALRRRLGTRRRLLAVHGMRRIARADLAFNRAAPPVEVSPLDGSVTLDGRRLAVAPVAEVPISRRYFLR